MPTWTYECPVHGEFEISGPVSQHQDHPPCPAQPSSQGFYMCMKETVQTYTRARAKDWAIKPIVVHVGANGKVRFPGHADAKVPKGFNRVELKTISEIESFERQMNQKLSSEAGRHLEAEEQHFEALCSKSRSELRQRMQTMTPFGRAFARLAIEMNNQRRRKKSDVGFHIDILHNDSANREAYRDEQTKWKPVRWI